MHAFEIEIMPDIRAHWTPNAALFDLPPAKSLTVM
jgi:ParB family chromosome partitioning protein